MGFRKGFLLQGRKRDNVIQQSSQSRSEKNENYSKKKPTSSNSSWLLDFGERSRLFNISRSPDRDLDENSVEEIADKPSWLISEQTDETSSVQGQQTTSQLTSSDLVASPQSPVTETSLLYRLRRKRRRNWFTEALELVLKLETEEKQVRVWKECINSIQQQDSNYLSSLRIGCALVSIRNDLITSTLVENELRMPLLCFLEFHASERPAFPSDVACKLCQYLSSFAAEPLKRTVMAKKSIELCFKLAETLLEIIQQHSDNESIGLVVLQTLKSLLETQDKWNGCRSRNGSQDLAFHISSLRRDLVAFWVLRIDGLLSRDPVALQCDEVGGIGLCFRVSESVEADFVSEVGERLDSTSPDDLRETTDLISSLQWICETSSESILSALGSDSVKQWISVLVDSLAWNSWYSPVSVTALDKLLLCCDDYPAHDTFWRMLEHINGEKLSTRAKFVASLSSIMVRGGDEFISKVSSCDKVTAAPILAEVFLDAIQAVPTDSSTNMMLAHNILNDFHGNIEVMRKVRDCGDTLAQFPVDKTWHELVRQYHNCNIKECYCCRITVDILWSLASMKPNRSLCKSDAGEHKIENCSFATVIGESWQSRVFRGQASSMEYENAVTFLVDSFLSVSTCSYLFSIFSCFVGKEPLSRKLSVLVVERCIHSLEVDDVSQDTCLFERVAPLVLLRKVSSFISHEEISTDLVKRLSIALLQRLSSKERVNSSHERRLAAESAGLLLPFGACVSGATSSYECICKPLILLFLGDISCKSLSVTQVHQAKAAVFIACMALASPRSPGATIEFVAVASFCVDMLASETPIDASLSALYDELKLGCLELLAACVEKSMVEGSDTCLDYSRAIADDIMRIMTHDDNLQIMRVENSEQVHERRVACWNVFTLAARKCRSLRPLESRYLSLTLDWGHIHTSSCHPLCTAAAMQLVTTMISRHATEDTVDSLEKSFPSIKADISQWTKLALDNKEEKDSQLVESTLKLLTAVEAIQPHHLDLDILNHLEPLRSSNNQVIRKLSATLLSLHA